MILTEKDIKQISRAITLELKKNRMSASDLARETGIHKTQVSKFIRGKFKKYSNNLEQICIKLKIDVIKSNQSGNPIDRAINDVWDGSTSHAQKLAKLIRDVGPMLLNQDR